MFQAPRKAKRLYFDVIPKAVDEYLTFVGKAHEAEPAALLENPAWHLHAGNVPQAASPVPFAMLLNLVSASNAESPSVLWGFINAYAPDATPENSPKLDQLVGYAIRYFHDFVKPTKTYRLASEQEAAALKDLAKGLSELGAGKDGETYQTLVYQVGKDHGFENLRDWFKAIYEVLLGQEQGPRFGNFIELYGLERSLALIQQGLNGALVKG
jgi:lysyl-tRNA synthetase class 1